MPSMINLGYGQKIKVDMTDFLYYLSSPEFTNNHKSIETLELIFDISLLQAT